MGMKDFETEELIAALNKNAAELRDVATAIELAVGILRPCEPPTKEETKDALMALYRAGKSETVAAIIRRHGADRFENLDPSQYAAVKFEAEESANE